MEVLLLQEGPPSLSALFTSLLGKSIGGRLYESRLGVSSLNKPRVFKSLVRVSTDRGDLPMVIIALILLLARIHVMKSLS